MNLNTKVQKSESRVDRRRSQKREEILRLAAARLAESGPDQMRMEDLADAADLARATLYSHFPTKEALVDAVVRPLFERSLEEVRPLKGLEPRAAVQGLIAVYWVLWGLDADGLRASYKLRKNALGSLAEIHFRFIGEVMELLGRAQAAGVLRVQDPVLTGRIVATLAIPLLELVGNHPEGESLFKAMLGDVLLGRE
jgi:AcrR family transcriptional regulator